MKSRYRNISIIFLSNKEEYSSANQYILCSVEKIGESFEYYWTSSDIMPSTQAYYYSRWATSRYINTYSWDYNKWFIENVKQAENKELRILWYSDTEILNLFKKPESKVESIEPKNNDGREYCFWCGSPTKQIPSMFTNFNICSNKDCQK